MRILFSENVLVPTPTQIEVVELLPNGQFGPNLAANFAISVEDAGSGPRVLRMQENGTHLKHRTWYAVRSVGAWPCVRPFEIQLVLQIGDADGNRFVTPADLSFINNAAAIPGIKPDDARCDIDGNRFCTPADLSVSNAHPSGFVPKPSGH